MIVLAAFLLMLPLVSCKRETFGRTDGELSVSLYIPGATMTRAETGTVSPIQEELKITSLQIWAFLSESGEFITYNKFDSSIEGFENTGLPNGAVTRFGLPLSPQMFALLTSNTRPKVDVYAVANAASAVTETLDQSTTRNQLDQLEVNAIGGNWPLSIGVPDAGLPMAGVLKETDVSGDYPVLNVTANNALRLTRAVSKIRFVFCQQGIPEKDEEPAVVGNEYCRIMSIKFDGTDNNKDCQIASSERLFTTLSFDLGNSPAYIPLNATIQDSSGDPIIPNNKLSIVEDPELLFFRGFGNETESAEHYEARLDQAISDDSQIGPIYLRETDKTISGTIVYRVGPGSEDLYARFSMDDADVFSRNHTWIVYACFVEETMKLELKVVVLPWEWEAYYEDFTTMSVNVIRRFTVFETPIPSFKKVQAGDFYDVSFWHTIEVDDEERENVLEGDIIIATPVGGTLHVIPVPGNDSGQVIANAISVSPATATIYPNYQNPANGRIEDCIIPIKIKCNPAAREIYTDQQLEGNYIDLHFSVETQDGRYIDLGSESIDYYRFILKKNWQQ